MRTYHPIQWAEHVQWHDVLHDRRFWGGVAIVVFVALLTAIVVIGATRGNVGQAGSYPYMWPYGPYGPMPVP